MKDVVVVERSTWKELFRLKCINIKSVSLSLKFLIRSSKVYIS